MGIGPAAAQTAVPDVTGTTPGGSSITVDPNTNVSPSANIGTGNQNSSSNVGSGDQSTSTNQSSATNTGSGTQSADTSQGTTTSSPSASPNYGSDMSDKKTGLDRADEAAGSNGQQGRDNARRRGDR